LPLVFSYGYNSANQRTSMTLADNSQWRYGYDTLGQVTSAKRFWSDGGYVAGQQFEYGFDNIGNRTFAASGGNEWGADLRYENYTANNLNEYLQRTLPGSFDVIGSANSNATVTANLQPASRKADYFRVDYKLNNKTGAVYQAITNVAVLGGDGDIVSTNIGNALVPQTPETLLSDLDGNLVTNGLWILTWDAENRLIGQDSTSGVPDSAKKSLRFGYDAQSRRISKTVSNWTGSAWAIASNIRFIYDGWNLLADLNATNNSVICSYMWGSDLSGSLQGAGGVGGLVAVSETGNGVHFAEFDGNGNVGGLVAATGGTNSATYEYGPFLGEIRATGSAATLNPLRKSGKYTDSESGFGYWGWRYMGDGRWLSRDPAGEAGGPNLSVFGNNDCVDNVDGLGNSSFSTVNSVPSLYPTVYAGPDVTRALKATLGDVATKYFATPLSERSCACKNLHNHNGPTAWDIFELFNIGRGESFLSKKGTEQWERTVQFEGHVYWASAANYALWGWANYLCSLDFHEPLYSRSEAVAKVLLYKTLFLWSQTEEAVAFTEWGYGYGDSDLSVHALTPLKSPSYVFIQDPDNVTTRSIFQWHWEGLNNTTGRKR